MSNQNPITLLMGAIKIIEKNTNLKPLDHKNLQYLLTKAIFICKKFQWSQGVEVDDSEPMEIN